jgi:hypothetical protein
MEDGELDFMKIVRSIEELLYEAITWLLFYPLTLWRCVRHPGTLTAYTTEELQDAPDQQFTENISPPLFLMLSVLVAHLVELSLGLRTDATADMSRGARVVLGSEQNLLAFRSLSFALFPMVMAVGVLRRRKLPFNRETFRGPFYLQCYIAAPFCLAVSIGTQLMRVGGPLLEPAGAAMLLAGLVWYLWVETRLLQQELGGPSLMALAQAFWLFLLASGLVVLAGWLLIM